MNELIEGSNDFSMKLQLLETQLELQKKEKELLAIKLDLEKKQAKGIASLENSLYSPKLMDHYMRMAKMMCDANAVPKNYMGKPVEVFMAMAAAYKVGLSVEQSLHAIAIINGYPKIWGNGLMALCQRHPHCEYIEEKRILSDKGNFLGYRCTVKRKGYPEHVKEFYLSDAERAGLLSRNKMVWGPWPERMCQMRARMALTDRFADALFGLDIIENDEEYGAVYDAQCEVVTGETKPPKTKTEQVKNMIRRPEGNNKPLTDNDGCVKISQGKVSTIKAIVEAKGLSEDRVRKMFEYYNVSSFEELSDDDALDLLDNLKRISDDKVVQEREEGGGQ